MNKEVEKMIISNILKILIPLVLIFILISKVSSLEYNDKLQEKESAKYKDITQIEYKSEELVKINIVRVNDLLLQGMNSSFYSVSDENKEYIIEVDNNVDINKIVRNSKSYEFTGIMIEMSDSIIDYIIDELKEENKMTKEAFIEKYSKFFISSFRNIYGLEKIIQTINMILYIFVLVYVIIAVYSINRTMKTIIRLKKEDLKKIKEELNGENIKIFRKNNIVLTESYVLDLSLGCICIKYSDIVWVYPYYDKIISLDKNIIIYAKQKMRMHKYDIALIRNSRKKSKELISEIYKEITEKTSDALIGYTLENREEFNQK